MNNTWLNKFLDEKLLKVAKKVEASYVNHIVRIFEGKSNKFSSIDDALTDFSSRLGLSNIELESLKKQAMIKMAGTYKVAVTDLQKLQDEGITDPKAIRFMAKSKNKHTKDTDSPFALDNEEGVELAEEAFKLQKDRTNDDTVDQGNELSNVAVGKYTLEQLRKFAEEFGKILPFKEPSLEAVEELKKQLGDIDVDTPYKASRYGFNFVDADSEGFPKPGSPIKVKVYQYSYLKDSFFKLLNEDLRKHLNQELSFKDWLNFLEEKIKSKEIESSEGWGLIDKLKKMHRQLFGDESSAPFLVDETQSRAPTQVKKMLKWFPTSYQEKILRMIAEGKYRHVLADASGRSHSYIFPTSYSRASFILMDSFAPFLAIKPKPNREQLVALIKSIVAKKQNKFTNEEFKSLLQELQIPFQETESADDSQRLPLHEKVKIDVENAKNTNYKPLTLSKESVDVSSKEGLLEKLNDHLFSAIRSDLPLAYEPNPSGAIKEMRLTDLGETKQDLTSKNIKHTDSKGNQIEVSNPKAGLHHTFEGTLPQKEKLKGPQFPKETKTPASKEAPQMDLGLPVPSKPESTEDKRKALLEEFKKNRNKLKNISKVMELLTKYAATGLWMDMEGKSYSTEEELKQKMYEEMISESEDELLSRVVASAMQEVQSAPQVLPLKKKFEPKDQEEEKLPLVARSKIKTLLSSTNNQDLKIKLAKILNKTKE